ncbi:unnamed protein product [Parnassius apollo]|uniref:(apollo) hypothetical protein n=1 Tax=Parnassius apollo TaxID=110799 RepID=A0A8S3Y2E6_PARAO|nr:unnamed protein product [Parnassius apollo]
MFPPPLRYPPPQDMRNAGIFGEVSQLINPPLKTKFQSLVDELKETSYASYWKKPLGNVKDPIPMLPEGLDPYNTTFGIKTPRKESLYDVILPKEPLEDKTVTSNWPGAQVNRNYCKPAFNPYLTFGCRSHVDKRGIYAKCSLTDDRIANGNANRSVLNTIQSNYLNLKKPRVGKVLAPTDNLNKVPEGFSFGILKTAENIQDCLSSCKINPEREFLRKCLSHLNSIRKYLSSRFPAKFFNGLYLNLKYFDTNKTGCLHKEFVYKLCNSKLIRLDPSLIEPLLSKWKAFDGTNIKYKCLVHILNFREPIPDIPHIPDYPTDCIELRTTYREMVKPGQEINESRMAGIPSGRFFDLDYPITPEYYCKADRICLPQESDVMSCISPSIFTLLHVNHRDMYAKRTPEVIKRVFQAAGENFTDEQFQSIWNEAEKHHSQGWVSFETFRQALYKISNSC